MTAARWYGTGDVRIEELEKPTPNQDEVLIRVEACGICGTDFHMFEGEYAYAIPPMILGHEFSGQVTQIGSNVKRISVGDRVAVNPNKNCGECIYCSRGKPHLCLNMKPYGIAQNGGFAEYCEVHSSVAIRLPEGVSYEEGSYVEPVSCAYHCIETASIFPGQSVAVFGPGAVGLILVQLAKASGARPVINIGTRDERLEKAKSLGADIIINSTREDALKRILDETQDVGVDVAIEAVGKGPVVKQAIDCVCKGGKAIVFGGCSQSDFVQISPYVLLNREISVTSAWLNPYTSEKAVRAIQSRIVRVKELTSHTVPLPEISQGFEIMREKPRGFMKVIVKP
jgi:threonine dehydrogenase-like Zn-dependent dehydrogenase